MVMRNVKNMSVTTSKRQTFLQVNLINIARKFPQGWLYVYISEYNFD